MKVPGTKKCSPVYKKFLRVGKEFYDHPGIQEIVHNPGELAAKKFKQLFHREIEEFDLMGMSATDADIFRRELNKTKKAMLSGKMGSKIGRLINSTAEQSRYSPEMAELHDTLMNIQHTHKGNTVHHSEGYKRVLDSLIDEASYRGFSERDVKKAVKRATKLDEDIFRIETDVKNNKAGAREELDSKLVEQKEFLLKHEGKIFKDFVKHIENDLPAIDAAVNKRVEEKRKQAKLDKIPYWRVAKDVEINDLLTEVSDSPFMRKALREYMLLTHDMFKVMKNGVNSYVNFISHGLEARGRSLESIEAIRKSLLERLMPNEKTGYYPHYNYRLNVDFLDGLMVHMQKLSEATTENMFINEANINDAIGGIESYLSARAKPRKTSVKNTDYSLNFPIVLKRYISEIDRFNFMSFTNEATRKALVNVKKMYKDGKLIDGHGSNLVDQMLDMHQAQTGVRWRDGVRTVDNPEFNNAVRLILNLEFASKLGLNARGALRNATQGFLNYVWFGKRGIQNANQLWASDRDLEIQVEMMMKESGLGFEELAPEQIEIGMTEMQAPTSRVRIGSKGEIEFVQPSKLAKTAYKVGKVGGKLGFMMRGVENFNRKYTFKLAFGTMYRKLLANKGFAEHMRDNKGLTGDKLQKEIMTRAREYAIRMTTLLHFDYAAVSKAKLLRNPIGQLLFQFQHYGLKFFELNKKVGGDAWSQFSSEKGFERFAGDEMARAGRMGLAYFLAPAIASAVSGVNFHNIIEHDTFERMGDLWTIFTGDDEEVKQRLYGRGPITTILPSPVVSDALAVGEIMELWELEEDDWLTLAIGYNDYANASNEQKAYSLLRTINAQLGRFARSSYPMLVNGNLGMMIQTEAGLYPSGQVKKARKEAAKYGKNISPELYEAIMELERIRERAIRPI
jgi:hypothetical protein